MTLYLPLMAGIAIGLLAGLVIIVLCRAPRPERPDTASLRLGTLLATNREVTVPAPKVICSWCRGHISGDPASTARPSHGICPGCRKQYFPASIPVINLNKN